MFTGLKSILSLIFGLVIGLLGIIPLLKDLQIISWSIPQIPKIILLLILCVGGIMVIIDGLFETFMHGGMAFVSILAGIVITCLGFISLFNTLGITSIAIPLLSPVFIHIIYLIICILLIIGAFMF